MKTVYSLQQFISVLSGLGYFADPAGVQHNPPLEHSKECGDLPSDDLKLAIRTFQAHYGLPPTGEADQPTQEKARQLVRNLHHGLKQTVSPNLSISEFYGTRTVSAVQQFQAQRKLPVTGVATASVRHAIEEDLKQQLRQSLGSAGFRNTPCSCAN
ncbi:MAG: peptidoglycan-binding domain-containing protein [Cyanobacteriota bacterium]